MNIALINNGKVENIIVAEMEFAQSLGFEQAIDVTGKTVAIGMLYTEGTFSEVPKFSYDQYGWLTEETNPERQTTIEPPLYEKKAIGQPFPMFNGTEWILKPYAAPPVVAPTPDPPAPVDYETRLTKLEFMRRFTMDELDAIYGAAENGVPETRKLRIGLEMLKMAEYVATTDTFTAEFVNGLAAAGLLTTARAAQILE